MKNDYYDIAYNDLLYLEEDYYKTNYNPMVVQAQQVAEMMLKSVLVLVNTNEALFFSNNLRQIYDAIHELQSDFVLDRANERVARDPRAGISTAVLTKVVRIDGRLKLAYASVGDSRIYVVDKEGNARLITRDEGEGRYLYNAIGDGDGSKGCTRQYGEIDLHKGDRIVLCSDGITGDYGEDLMSERELGFIVSRSRDARNASQNLIAGARKKDDRTAIVFGEF